MNTSSLSLPPDLAEFVEGKVESGAYQTENEVVREALRLLRERDRLREIRLADLRKELQIGLDQAERGDVAPLDVAAIKSKGRKLLARRGKKN